MTLTNFPSGISSFGIPVIGSSPSIPTTSTKYLFVSSVIGGNGNPGSFDSPLATLAYAATLAGVNDVIVLLPGHAESIIAAGTVTLSVAGLQVIGLGTGSKRPTFTFSTATTASMLISGAGVNISNIVGVAGINSLANPIDVTGGTPSIQIEWQDVSTTYQAVSCVRMTSVVNAKLNLKYVGTAGSAVCLNPVQLAGCTVVEINIDFYGTAGTAIVNTVAAGASKDVVVYGYMYNSGTTTGAKNFVDTVTGSTWYINVDDGAAGFPYTGGSASAPVLDSAASISQALYGTGIASWPASAAYANGVSIAADLGYIQDQIWKTGGTVLPASTSLFGILGGSSGQGIPTAWPASAAYAAGKSLAAVLGYLQDNIVNGTGTALTTNYSLFDQIAGTKGVAVWPASAGHGNGTSLAQVLGYVQDTGEKCVTTTAATMNTGTDTVFTIAGGPIQISSLVGLFTTVNTGAASTFAAQINATAGGVTALAIASGPTSGAAAGTVLVLPAATGSAITAVAAGAHIQVFPNTWIAPAGTIQAIVAGANTVGLVQWFLRYIPLAPGVTVTAGY
jgi:hypothetical protein